MSSVRHRESAEHRQRVMDELRIVQGPVRDAFLAVPRETFVPEWERDHGLAAVYNARAPLVTKQDAHGNAISSASAPAIMAPMLWALDVHRGMRVLEIGAGTGYNAALLKELVGPKGRVVSVDVDRDLVARARAALRASGHRVEVVLGDGRLGHARRAPYDRIIATVSLDEVPRSWHDQLAPDGLVVMPLKLAPGAAYEAVPVLRRAAAGFDGPVHCYAGFMEVRDSSDAGSPTAELKASASGEWELRLRGAAVHRLDVRGRRRLLALLTPPPDRRRRLGPAGESSSFWTYASLAFGVDGLSLFSGRQSGVGLVTKRCDSAALFAFDGPGAAVIAGWGTTDAENRLRAAYAAWRDAGSPGSQDLRLRVSYGPDGRSRIRARWPVPAGNRTR